MDNFDLKKFLTENRLTTPSRLSRTPMDQDTNLSEGSNQAPLTFQFDYFDPTGDNVEGIQGGYAVYYCKFEGETLMLKIGAGQTCSRSGDCEIVEWHTEYLEIESARG